MILVTGGAGFIGRALVRRLVDEGEEVRVFDNESRSKLQFISHPDVELVHGDIRDLSAVHDALRGVDEVIHLAYVNGTKTFYSDPWRVLDVGVKGILNLVDACFMRGNVDRLTLISSSEVARAKVTPDESVPLVIPDPFNPRYSYSAGKIISEMLAIHSGVFKRLLIIRPFNIYGPGMSTGHVIPDFIAQLKTTSGGNDPVPFQMIGTGDETRSFCYIDDFVNGLMLAREKGEHNGVYNIGTPEEVTIAELAHCVAKVMGREIILSCKNQLREGDVPRRKPDISKIAELGYAPNVTLDAGLRSMVQ